MIVPQVDIKAISEMEVRDLKAALAALEYHDHPGSPFSEHRSFELLEAGGDYFFRISDLISMKQIHFRFCISGGFEHSHPKTMMAIAALYRALQEETNNHSLHLTPTRTGNSGRRNGRK